MTALNHSADFSTTTDNISYDYYPDFIPDPRQVYQSPIGILRLCLCAVGLTLNLLSIVAVAHIPMRNTNHIKLIMSLTVSDTLFILSVMFHFLHRLLRNPPVCVTVLGTQVLNAVLLATLLNLLSMALDHYIAIMKPLRYPLILTNFRGNCCILAIWLTSIGLSCLNYIIVLCTPSDRDYFSFCERVSLSFSPEIINLVVVVATFVILMMVYIKIYMVVRKLMREHRSIAAQDETHSYKAVVTTFLILGTFVCCWIPYWTFQITMMVLYMIDPEQEHPHEYLINDILFLFLLSNTLCDPIIYAARLGQVQNGYKRMLFKLFPQYRRSLNERDFRSLNGTRRSHRRNTTASLLIDAETNYQASRQRGVSDPDLTTASQVTEGADETGVDNCTELVDLTPQVDSLALQA